MPLRIVDGLPPFGELVVGSTNTVVDWLVHLAIALSAGTTFGVVLGRLAHRLAPALILGLLYGAVWWFLGAL
ncbi:hypothetical protein ACIBAG_28065 [Streptomyces sp. NPDC051243]|uniref:hypothetical protein n=1 Tax=Streptomyces sp. NPDC051243 TaxID=3365646 RepID=UPI0037B475D6